MTIPVASPSITFNNYTNIQGSMTTKGHQEPPLPPLDHRCNAKRRNHNNSMSDINHNNNQHPCMDAHRSTKKTNNIGVSIVMKLRATMCVLIREIMGDIPLFCLIYNWPLLQFEFSHALSLPCVMSCNPPFSKSFVKTKKEGFLKMKMASFVGLVNPDSWHTSNAQTSFISFFLTYPCTFHISNPLLFHMLILQNLFQK